MPNIWVLPPADGSRNILSVSGRTYATTPSTPILVPDFDALVLLANGWYGANSFISGGSALYLAGFSSATQRSITSVIGTDASGNSGIGPLSLAKTYYMGPVGTRCHQTQAFFATNKQAQARRGFYTRDEITQIKLVLPGYYVSNFSFGNTQQETGTGAASTWTAALEYPLGGTVLGSFKLAGNPTMVCPDLSFIETDWMMLTTSIPKNVIAAIRMFFQNPNGIIFTDKAATHNNATFGDQLTAAVSGLTDNTLSGAYGGDDVNNSLGPLIILGMTRNATVVILGDSRADGETDVQDSSGDVGEWARSIGPTLAYSNFGVRGDGAVKFLASGTNRTKLASQYFSHMAVNYGINDIELFGQTAQQVLANRQAMQAAIGLPMFHSTVLPHANAGNTAPNNVGFNTTRAALNDLIRAGVPWAQFTENADAVETSRGSGIWQAGFSTDFLHGNQAGNVQIKNSGAINPALFKR